MNGNPYQVYTGESSDTCFLLLSGYNLPSSLDLIIYGAYDTREQAQHAMDEVAFNTTVDHKIDAWKVRENMEDFKVTAPQLSICEVPKNREPWEFNSYRDTKLKFRKDCGIDPFWLEEKAA